MAEITALKPDPRASWRVQVYLDGRRWRVIPFAAAAGLRVGMSLDPAGQQQIEDRSSEAEALQRVGRLLVERPRSEAELRQRLERAGVAPETTQRVLERLRRNGDVDDGAFARDWVENRQTFRPRGAAMLRAELRRKGVASSEIDSALTEVDEPAAAWSAAQRVGQRWPTLDPSARRQKLYAYLQRRGFDHDTIRLVLHRLQAAAEGDSEETS